MSSGTGSLPRLDFTQADLKAVAEGILALQPDPVPRFRLLHEVLMRPDPDDAAYREAESGPQDSRWIALLRAP